MAIRVAVLAIVAACFAAGGCSTLTEYGSLRKESLRNEQGYVIGYKEMLRNEATGEVVARVSMYTPLLNDAGQLVGYEEQARGGAIIRDLDGRSIGARFSDVRSRKSLVIVMRAADAPAMAKVTQPKVWELMASLSASDLRRVH
ncbi:MAG: hypothetical protein ACRET8_10545 [Burkholderiales bacterium]